MCGLIFSSRLIFHFFGRQERAKSTKIWLGFSLFPQNGMFLRLQWKPWGSILRFWSAFELPRSYVRKLHKFIESAIKDAKMNVTWHQILGACPVTSREWSIFQSTFWEESSWLWNTTCISEGDVQNGNFLNFDFIYPSFLTKISNLPKTGPTLREYFLSVLGLMGSVLLNRKCDIAKCVVP